MKFLAQDDTFDVIATGFLLGINYREISSIPVGYERQYEMHSLDFEEFLWALGIGQSAILSLKENFDNKIPVEKGGTSSLDSLLKKDEIKYGYKIVNGNVVQTGKKITVPHYICMFL